MADEAEIVFYPVVGWESATLPDGNVMLSVSYLPGVPSMPVTTEQMQTLAEVHRFGMTESQCDELAQVLQRAAEQSRKRRDAGC